MRRHKGQFIMYNMEDGRAERTPQGAGGGRGVTVKTSKMHHLLFLLTLSRRSETYILCGGRLGPNTNQLPIAQ